MMCVQYADPMCTFLWLRQIEYAQVSAIESILPVALAGEHSEKPDQNGGIKLQLEDRSLVRATPDRA